MANKRLTYKTQGDATRCSHYCTGPGINKDAVVQRLGEYEDTGLSPEEMSSSKHGRWEKKDVVKILCSGKILDGFCQCDNCGSIFPYHYSEYDYCPNCGLKMDGGVEDE